MRSPWGKEGWAGEGLPGEGGSAKAGSWSDTLAPSHPHTLTPSHPHPHTLTPSHTHTLTPSHPHTPTPSHPHTLTPCVRCEDGGQCYPRTSSSGKFIGDFRTRRFVPPWMQPRGKSQVNLTQMPPDSGGNCIGVDSRNYRIAPGLPLGWFQNASSWTFTGKFRTRRFVFRGENSTFFAAAGD